MVRSAALRAFHFAKRRSSVSIRGWWQRLGTPSRWPGRARRLQRCGVLRLRRRCDARGGRSAARWQPLTTRLRRQMRARWLPKLTAWVQRPPRARPRGGRDVKQRRRPAPNGGRRTGSRSALCHHRLSALRRTRCSRRRPSCRKSATTRTPRQSGRHSSTSRPRCRWCGEKKRR